MKKIKSVKASSNLHESGFSLIELLIAIAIVGIVFAGIYSIFFTSNRTYITQEEIVDAQQRARISLEFMTRDIRMAGLDPIGNAEDTVDEDGAGFKEATASKMRFTMDLDMNGGIDTSNSIVGRILNEERVSYALVGSELMRGVYENTDDERWDIIIDGIRSLAFSYEDAAGTVIPLPVSVNNLNRIRVINIRLICDFRDAQGAIFTRTLSTTVTCRNPVE